jgi:hypothetical protein
LGNSTETHHETRNEVQSEVAMLDAIEGLGPLRLTLLGLGALLLTWMPELRRVRGR